MAFFPQARLDVLVDLALGADVTADPSEWAWTTDITAHVRLDGDERIRITRGRAEGQDLAGLSKIRLKLDNTGGRFVPRNPSGPYYGQLTKSTPLRVRLRRVHDPFGTASAEGWGTAPSGDAYSSFGAGGSVLSTDASVSGGAARHSVPVDNAYRVSWLPTVDLADVEVRCAFEVVDVSDVTGAPLEPANILLRMQDISTYYMTRVEITTAEAVVCRLMTTAGTLASTTVDGLTYSGQSLRVAAAVQGQTMRLKVWDPAGDEPAGWTVSADVPAAQQLTRGGVGIRSGVASGNTNTKPVEVAYDDLQVLVTRGTGLVAAWPPRWDLTGRDNWVHVQADGIQRQLRQRTPATLSQWRRTILAAAEQGLLAYWPGEDEDRAGQIASALPGGSPMTVSGTVAFAALSGTTRTVPGLGDITVGTKPLPNFAGGGQAIGQAPAGVSSPTAWSVLFVAKSRASEAGEDIVLARWATPGGTHVKWEVRQNTAGGTEVAGYTSAGVRTVLLSLGGSDFDLTQYRVEALQSGTSAVVRMYIGGILFDSDTLAGTTLGRPTTCALNPDSNTVSGDSGFYAGHVEVWDTDTPPTIQPFTFFDADLSPDEYGAEVQAYYGYWNEAAHLRLARLCAEDGVSLAITDVDEQCVQRMGSQLPAAQLDLYAECEDVDGGMLYETVHFGLGYIPRQHRYNPAAALTLDYASGEVAPPLEPTDDDLATRNAVTVHRTAGSAATHVDTGSVAEVGYYRDEVTINLAADNMLDGQARWRVHLGTTDEMRYPALSINLGGSPGLVDDWLACDIGSRVQVDSPPADITPDPVDVIIVGYAEELASRWWSATATCEPARPWEVWTVEGGRLGRLASDGSTLAADVDADDTSLSVATPSGPLWTVDAGQVPFDVFVGGERMTVTAVAGASSPQTFTVTRSVNGVVKSHSAGATVRPWRNGVLAL